MDLVVGATGDLGGEICRRAVERGRPVRALVRAASDPLRVEQLRGLGVEIVVGDLRDRTSLANACRGVQGVMTSATAIFRPESLVEVDAVGQLNLVDIACQAGVERFAYVSLSDGMEGDYPLVRAKRSVEQRLKERGVCYTIVRPSYFMDSWLSPVVGFDAANAKAQIYGDGAPRISWIALGDVAEFVVRMLDSSAAENRTIEVGGPEALSPLEVVRIFEGVSGRAFDLQHVPTDALHAKLTDATDSKQQSLLGLMLAHAQGDSIDMRTTLDDFPVQLTSVQAYACQLLATVPLA
jgi:uncharacterized protein YbjT (DUF2867 family)